MHLGFLVKNAVKSVLPQFYTSGVWLLWLGTRWRVKAWDSTWGRRGAGPGQQIWLLRFPCEMLCLAPAYPAEKREKLCEPMLVWDPLAGAVSSSPWFLKFLCPNAKAVLAEIAFYMYTHTFTQHMQFLAKNRRGLISSSINVFCWKLKW